MQLTDVHQNITLPTTSGTDTGSQISWYFFWSTSDET